MTSWRQPCSDSLAMPTMIPGGWHCVTAFRRGGDLPRRLYHDDGPFYLLQAAYSAKHGKPVVRKLMNLMSLANDLFQLHQDTLWIFSVILGHFERGREPIANGLRRSGH